MNCPLCGSLKISSSPVKSHNPGYSYTLCNECDLVFSEPFEEPGASWYESSGIYKEPRKFQKLLYSWGRQAIYHSQTPTTFAQRKVLEHLKQVACPEDMLLDIGCGQGHFLYQARSLGLLVYGVDHNPEVINYAHSNLNLENIFIRDVRNFIEDCSQKFQFITMFEVLEHLANPVSVIQELTKLLHPGGYLYLSVPSYDRWPKCFHPVIDSPPHHLTLWSEKSLGYLLSLANLRSIQVFRKPLNLHDALAHFHWAPIIFLLKTFSLGRGFTLIAICQK